VYLRKNFKPTNKKESSRWYLFLASRQAEVFKLTRVAKCDNVTVAACCCSVSGGLCPLCYFQRDCVQLHTKAGFTRRIWSRNERFRLYHWHYFSPMASAFPEASFSRKSLL